jgi:electron transport complex protein RnfA
VPLQLQALRLFVFLPLSVLLIAPVLKLLTGPDWPSMGSGRCCWATPAYWAGLLNAKMIKACCRRRTEPGRRAGFLAGAEPVQRLAPTHADNDIPLPFRGLPIDLISAGLIAVAFLGFSGLIKT